MAEAATETRTTRIVIIDDDPSFLSIVHRIFAQAGFDAVAINEPVEGLLAASEPGVDVVLSDVQMPNLTGMDLLKELKLRKVDAEVVLMTGSGSVASAVEALQAGAYDYLTKPFEDHDRVKRTVARAAEKHRLKVRAQQLAGMLDVKRSFEDLVGQSPKMTEVFRLVESVGSSAATVVIQGESGTGKELVARALHRRSPRNNQPFVTVNCSALTETLLESELFGHTKGAFTGAIAAKKGLFQAANGGTIFLDEIGDMPLATQARLLRVLQEGEVRPVGASANIQVDVRVIAATHVNLEKARKAGKFREDLFYRLNVIAIHLPALRDRTEDIAPLAHHFLSIYAPKMKKNLTGFTHEALARLSTHAWPGNVRELENVIERAVVLCTGTQITENDLPPTLGGNPTSSDVDPASLSHLAFAEAKELAINGFERRYLASVLRKTHGNITHAAERAGMDRSNFRRLLRHHGIGVRADSDDEKDTKDNA